MGSADQFELLGFAEGDAVTDLDDLSGGRLESFLFLRVLIGVATAQVVRLLAKSGADQFLAGPFDLTGDDVHVAKFALVCPGLVPGFVKDLAGGLRNAVLGPGW